MNKRGLLLFVFIVFLIAYNSLVMAAENEVIINNPQVIEGTVFVPADVLKELGYTISYNPGKSARIESREFIFFFADNIYGRETISVINKMSDFSTDMELDPAIQVEGQQILLPMPLILELGDIFVNYDEIKNVLTISDSKSTSKKSRTPEIKIENEYSKDQLLGLAEEYKEVSFARLSSNDKTDFNRYTEWLMKYKGEERKLAAVNISSIAITFRVAGRSPDLSISLAAEAVLHNSDNSIILNNFAGLLKETGEIDEALAVFNSSLSIASNAPALTNIGNIYLDQGSEDEAVNYFKEAININNDFAESHRGLVNYWVKKGDYKKSLEETQKYQKNSLVAMACNKGVEKDQLRYLKEPTKDNLEEIKEEIQGLCEIKPLTIADLIEKYDRERAEEFRKKFTELKEDEYFRLPDLISIENFTYNDYTIVSAFININDKYHEFHETALENHYQRFFGMSREEFAQFSNTPEGREKCIEWDENIDKAEDNYWKLKLRSYTDEDLKEIFTENEVGEIKVIEPFAGVSVGMLPREYNLENVIAENHFINYDNIRNYLDIYMQLKFGEYADKRDLIFDDHGSAVDVLNKKYVEKIEELQAQFDKLRSEFYAGGEGKDSSEEDGSGVDLGKIMEDLNNLKEEYTSKADEIKEKYFSKWLSLYVEFYPEYKTDIELYWTVLAPHVKSMNIPNLLYLEQVNLKNMVYTYTRNLLSEYNRTGGKVTEGIVNYDLSQPLKKEDREYKEALRDRIYKEIEQANKQFKEAKDFDLDELVISLGLASFKLHFSRQSIELKALNKLVDFDWSGWVDKNISVIFSTANSTNLGSLMIGEDGLQNVSIRNSSLSSGVLSDILSSGPIDALNILLVSPAQSSQELPILFNR